VCGLGRAATPAANPTVVLACAGDVPTLEDGSRRVDSAARAACLACRVVNVVDLMTLQPSTSIRTIWSDRAQLRRAFTRDNRSSSRYHGYPWTDPRLTPTGRTEVTTTCRIARL